VSILLFRRGRGRGEGGERGIQRGEIVCTIVFQVPLAFCRSFCCTYLKSKVFNYSKPHVVTHITVSRCGGDLSQDFRISNMQDFLKGNAILCFVRAFLWFVRAFLWFVRASARQIAPVPSGFEAQARINDHLHSSYCSLHFGRRSFLSVFLVAHRSCVSLQWIEITITKPNSSKRQCASRGPGQNK